MSLLDFILRRNGKPKKQLPRRQPSRTPSYQPRVEVLEERCCPSVDFGFAIGMGSTGWDEGNAIATDSAGNVLVTGFFQGTADFDPGDGTSNMTSAVNSSYGDIFVAKYSSDGSLIWAKSFGGTNFDDAGLDISVDSAGNVYTTGYFGGTVDFDPGVSTFDLTSSGSKDIFVSKLDASGNFLWARAMGGVHQDYGSGISVDTAGNVYTTGNFVGTVDFDPGTGTFNLTNSDIFVSKLDTSGNFLWARAMGGSNGSTGHSKISVDSAGNVYTTGSLAGTADFDPGTENFELTSAGYRDIFISKLDASGNFVWAKSMGGTRWDRGEGIALDSTGNVYTTGYFEGTVDFDPGAGTFKLTSARDFDIFVSKLDASGNFVWAKSMGGTDWDIGKGISIDSAGNVYTTGRFRGTADFDPGPGTAYLTSNRFYDIFVSKLDSSGNFLWAKAMGGTNTGLGSGISVDSAGNVYTTGYFRFAADFDPDAGSYFLTSAGVDDIFISKLTQSDFISDQYDINDPPIINTSVNRVSHPHSGLVFSNANGNPIWISDPDAGSAPVELALWIDHATMSLAGTAGLTFSVGDGTGDSAMVFRGTITDINKALDGLRVSREQGYHTTVDLVITVDDLGNTGSGGPKSDSKSIKITFAAQKWQNFGGVFRNGNWHKDDDGSQGFHPLDSSSFFGLVITETQESKIDEIGSSDSSITHGKSNRSARELVFSVDASSRGTTVSEGRSHSRATPRSGKVEVEEEKEEVQDQDDSEEAASQNEQELNDLPVAYWNEDLEEMARIGIIDEIVEDVFLVFEKNLETNESLIDLAFEDRPENWLDTDRVTVSAAFVMALGMMQSARKNPIRVRVDVDELKAMLGSVKSQ